MNIIQTEPNANGSRPPIQSRSGETAPTGYTALLDGLDTSVFYEHNGFVDLTIEDGTVTDMTANTEAWEAWKASLPPEPEPEPTAEDITLDLIADHEERICMLELNA